MVSDDRNRSAEFPSAHWTSSIQIGEALWRRRSNMGLSLIEVAARITVDPEIVRALEDSDFASLPPRATTIAVARAYARIVGLSQRWVTRALGDALRRYEETNVA